MKNIWQTLYAIDRRVLYGRDVPYDGRVPWMLSARSVTAFIRACNYAPLPSPWGLPRAVVNGFFALNLGAGVAAGQHAERE